MNIFVTGATGYLGSAVARAAQAAGHTVLALARDERAREAVEREGWRAAMGDLRDSEGLALQAAAADAVVHAANAGGGDAARLDESATRAMVGALAGSGKPFVYTSGVWVIGPTGPEPATEDTPARPLALVAWRAALEEWLRAAAHGGVRTVVLRPGVAYGGGGGIPAALGRGELPLVGDGEQVWPLVHRDDLAALYLAALERAEAGSTLHGVADHLTATQVWQAFATQPAPLRASLAEARASLGDFADALATSQRVAARQTRERTGWVPRRSPPVAGAPAGLPRRAAAVR